MTIADDIIHGKRPQFDAYLAQGETLDDIDEYGFTPLIECAIVNNIEVAKELIARNVIVDNPDATGRTALHWAVDNNNLELTKLLLQHGANPNAYNRGGQPVLVFPLLREQWLMKQTLYQAGASLDFALDFINTKLIGHRFELKGDVDIVNSAGEFIELDYEGFFLEFSLAAIRDSLSRFRNNFAARNLRAYFAEMCEIIDGYQVAGDLLLYQHQRLEPFQLEQKITPLLQQHLLLLPVAYRGHAITFIRCGEFFAKCDRGINSKREGTVNLYHIENIAAFTPAFCRQLLFQKQTERYVHHTINQDLGLNPIATLPITPQISGNCSWANVEAAVPVAFVLQRLAAEGEALNLLAVAKQAIALYSQWLTWDKDRALDECLLTLDAASVTRRASKTSILAALLFQACDYGQNVHMQRAEKIIPHLLHSDYAYILDSYLETYCIKRLTKRGNNLLKLLDDFGIDPNTGVSMVATMIRDGKLKT